MSQKLQQQLKELGSKLESPPASKDALVKLLKVGISLYICMRFEFQLKSALFFFWFADCFVLVWELCFWMHA